MAQGLGKVVYQKQDLGTRAGLEALKIAVLIRLGVAAGSYSYPERPYDNAHANL